MRKSDYLKGLLAVFLIMVGVNKFVPFLPGMGLSSEANDFMTALVQTGYMMPLVALIEIACGFLLLSRRMTPFVLVMLAPISVNILLFHLFLDPSTIWMAAFVFISNAYLLYENRAFYTPIFMAMVCGEKFTLDQLREHHFTNA